MNFDEAATLPIALTTMHNAVVTNGALQPGQSVLVQGASSGVGLMAMQIAKLKGASLVIGSSTDAARRARLKEFGADLAIDSSDPGWVDQVLKATSGQGVDLIVDQVSGQIANQNLAATKVLGRIVNVGRLGGTHADFNFDLHAARRITYVGVTFRTRSIEEIRAIFAEHTPIVEPLSLNEAYLDVTENLQGIPLARDIALQIRARIKAETGLNASAGISYNKFLAKLASDHRKPNGQYVISPEMGAAFVEGLPVGRFHGIGPATTAKFNALGIHTGLDIRNQTLPFLQQHFGKAGSYYYWISRGVDDRPVRANRIRKSVGAENTFSTDLTEFEPMKAELLPLIDKVWRHCEATCNKGRTVTLKVKFADFEIITRSRSVASAVGSRDDLERLSVALLQGEMPLPKPVRLLGVSLSSLQEHDDGTEAQLALLI